MPRREKFSQAMPDCLSQAIFPEAMAAKKPFGFLQNFVDFSKDTNRYFLGPDRQTTEKLPLPAEAFRRAQRSMNRAVGCRSKLSHAWEQQAGGRGEQEAPGTSEAVHRESGAQREVPEGEWEGMRADLYSIIIAAFQAAPAKCLGVC